MKTLSPGTLILAIFAVLFGLVGAYAVKRHLRERPEPPPPVRVRPQTIPLAGADLVPGRTITLGDVALARMTPEEIENRNLPAGFMTQPSQVIGRTLREPVSRGSAFQISSFYAEGLGPNLADRLAPGYRAVTIPVEDEAAKAGLISPGAMVDILFRTQADARQHIPETTVTLLESVEVLAVGHQTFQGAQSTVRRTSTRRPDVTVTLAVTPKQAKALKVVQGRGAISLALRGPEDTELAENPTPQTLAGLLGLPKPEKPFATQIYRRGSLTTMVFEKGRPTMIPVAVGALPVRTASRSSAPAAVRGRLVNETRALAASDSPEPQAPCGCEDN